VLAQVGEVLGLVAEGHGQHDEFGARGGVLVLETFEGAFGYQRGTRWAASAARVS